MGLPLVYTLESLRARWRGALVAVLGIAGSVSVFVAMLALARGFQAALVGSGSPHNAMIRRAGATSEMDSVLLLEQVRALSDQPEFAKDEVGTLLSPEVVVLAALPLRESGFDANVQVRGVTPRAFAVHDGVRVVQGRPFRPGLAELVVGKSALRSYAGLALHAPVQLGGREWTVVGVLDASGSSFDSELWCDADLLATAYQRPLGVYQSAVARLAKPADLEPLAKRLAKDPRLTVQVERETEYYAKASETMARLIQTLGLLVATVMGVGAVFGALNTMYSAVAERTREIGTIRALGFGAAPVVACFVIEALFLALLGGVLGCLAALPVNGASASTLNFDTFSHLAFAFRITPDLLLAGLAFAVLMGLAGGVPPAVRAARLPVTAALRES